MLTSRDRLSLNRESYFLTVSPTFKGSSLNKQEYLGGSKTTRVFGVTKHSNIGFEGLVPSAKSLLYKREDLSSILSTDTKVAWCDGACL